MSGWIALVLLLALAVLAACSGSIPALRVLTGAQDPSGPCGIDQDDDWTALLGGDQEDLPPPEPGAPVQR